MGAHLAHSFKSVLALTPGRRGCVPLKLVEELGPQPMLADEGAGRGLSAGVAWPGSALPHAQDTALPQPARKKRPVRRSVSFAAYPNAAKQGGGKEEEVECGGGLAGTELRRYRRHSARRLSMCSLVVYMHDPEHALPAPVGQPSEGHSIKDNGNTRLSARNQEDSLVAAAR